MQAATQQQVFIVSRAYDYLFFIFAPLLGLCLGYIITMPLTVSSPLLAEFDKARGLFYFLFYTPFIHAHLILVIFRSHFNKNIFRQHPYRFVIVPLLLFLLMLVNNWILVGALVVGIWWDVYHSSLQTFGLGRIYDKKINESAVTGRRLDLWLNLVLYAGPILSGATLASHLHLTSGHLDSLNAPAFRMIPIYIEGNRGTIARFVIGAGVLYTVYYVYAYWRLYQNGYHVSFHKVLLLANTAACTLLAWGMNSFGQAFFIVNFFHAFQYFGLVLWSERQNLVNVFHLGKIPFGVFITVVLVVCSCFGYGIWADYAARGNYGTVAIAIINVVALMHFWYDGFIWSVRKKQV